MKNLLFFLWMMFFPLINDIADYFVFKTEQERKNENADSIMNWAIYIAVGIILYQNQ